MVSAWAWAGRGTSSCWMGRAHDDAGSLFARSQQQQQQQQHNTQQSPPMPMPMLARPTPAHRALVHPNHHSHTHAAPST